MHQIGSIHFDFRMQSETFARDLYGRWDRFYANCFESVADEVLDQFNQPDREIEIEKLELDLGRMAEDALDTQFPLRLREKLAEALVQCFNGSEESQKPNIITKAENALQFLCMFLLHGTLPWNVKQEHRDIHQLFRSVLRENADAFRQFLQTYGHYTSLQQRLVYQLDDPELEKGIYVLSSGSAGFIISYIRLLQVKYKEMEQPGIREKDYHDSVWLVVYAYLLTQRSSYFDKKSFIGQTILQLSARYHVSYDSLLTLLTQELEAFHKKQSVSIELLRILGALQTELSERHLKESSINAAKFYRILYRSLLKEPDQPVSESALRNLMRILAGTDSCRMFLQPLREEEIIRLLPVIFPSESDFVVHFSQSLDQQKDQGALQGKMGGEFQLLKWQIIFPVLSDQRDSGFNRKQFVLSVLRKIAAHYNLELSFLLEYLVGEPGFLIRMDKELKTILCSIRDELSPVWQEAGEKEWVSGGEIPVRKKRFLQLLSESSYRRKIIENTQEPERYRIIEWLWPEEKEFILSYVQALDRLDQYDFPKAKAGSNVSRIKWLFLFTVFAEMPEDNFNRRSFVSRVLSQIAAHYNWGYFDLLYYFHQEKWNVRLPFRLEQLLDELYRKEKKHWIDLIVLDTEETNKYEYISCFTKTDPAFVKSCLSVLDSFGHKGALQGKTSGSFNEIKWRVVFEVLIESRNVAFNKKQFAWQVLTKIAAHYHLTLYELLAYVREFRYLSGDSRLKEMAFIIHQLYEEQRMQDTSPAGKEIGKWKEQTELNVLLAGSEGNVQETPRSGSIKKDVVLIHIENMENQSIYVQNAGMVLLSPYLPRLFMMLHLLEGNKLKDQEAQVRAIYLLQYLVSGKTDFPEHEMALNKLFAGLKTGWPVPRTIQMTQEETEVADSLLKGVLQHWDKLKNTSVAALREAFLCREGILEEKEDHYSLTVQTKPYDILLDSVPWNFRSIKHAWMEKGIQVQWR